MLTRLAELPLLVVLLGVCGVPGAGAGAAMPWRPTTTNMPATSSIPR